MTLLTGETEVFSADTADGRAVVMFLARREPGGRGADGILRELGRLEDEGWRLSIGRMIDDTAPNGASALDSGFAHEIDIAGVFEAPSLAAALLGTVRLERAGWNRLFATEWLIGPREFAAVHGAAVPRARDWGFLALWEWNDAWCAASPERRVEYDAECDVAFQGDLALGIDIAGRHRLDWAHRWHHLGIWHAPSLEAIDRAMKGHERAADFRFTTSRHYVGRIVPFAELLAGSPS